MWDLNRGKKDQVHYSILKIDEQSQKKHIKMDSEHDQHRTRQNLHETGEGKQQVTANNDVVSCHQQQGRKGDIDNLDSKGIEW